MTTFLATLNAGGGFAGHTDWRIPNYKELTSILDLEKWNPAVSAVFHNGAGCTGCSDVTAATCSCTSSNAYWSSTTNREPPYFYAWSVYFDAGHVEPEFKSFVPGYVRARAVRGAGGLPKTGQTTSYGPGSDGAVQAGAALSYTDNGDGTITDNVTGLIWEKKDDSAGIHGQNNTYTWGIASAPYTMNGTMVTTFLATLNAGSGFAGHTDWRIPNYKELTSILNLEIVAPAVSVAFHNGGGCTGCSDVTVATCSCTSHVYWSSTNSPGDPSSALVVDLGGGYVDYHTKTFTWSARAVRGGL